MQRADHPASLRGPRGPGGARAAPQPGPGAGGLRDRRGGLRGRCTRRRARRRGGGPGAAASGRPARARAGGRAGHGALMDRDLRYAAKSTQDAKGSTDRQHQRMEAAIQAEGREPYGRPYVDEAKSGYHGNRGQDLDAVMAEAERLVAQGDQVRLWFDHSDRSSRGAGVEARHTVEVMLWALKAGVELRSVRDPDTFRSLSSAASMGDRNHGDSKVKAERVAEGHAERRASGGYHGGPEPYALAYPVDPDQPTRTMPDGSTRPNTRPWLPLVVRPEQAAVVAR